MNTENDMSYPEFCRLLSGVTYKTPLGEIVRIRAEDDKEVLKHFTAQEHRIRTEWRSKQTANEFSNMSQADKVKATQEVQQIFAKMFGAHTT